ncbi:MAG: hypothetical protein OEV40_22400 [Acidimicrobiia bacterium]|nr:hypothetical protein [Acidimicrobiia bacterium]
MALSNRRESVGRTRFLLALSLSTLTALAVAAPLAIQAVNADQPTFVAGDPANGGGADRADDDLAISRDRSLATESEGGLGGIGTRPAAKGQGQTSKTESGDSGTAAPDPAPDSAVLTNPAPAPSDDPPVEPAETTTTIEATTTTEDPDPTTPTSEDTTTTTEDPDATTSTSDDTGSTTSTTDTTAPPETTTTSGPGPTSSSNPVSLP